MLSMTEWSWNNIRQLPTEFKQTVHFNHEKEFSSFFVSEMKFPFTRQYSNNKLHIINYYKWYSLLHYNCWGKQSFKEPALVIAEQTLSL